MIDVKDSYLGQFNFISSVSGHLFNGAAVEVNIAPGVPVMEFVL